MINIVIVGTETKNGIKLLKTVEKAIKDVPKKIIIKIVNETSSNNYGIRNVPGLVIDGKVVCQGKVLSEREVHKLLSSYA